MRGAATAKSNFALRDAQVREHDHDDQCAQAGADGDGGDVLVGVAVVQAHGSQHAEHRAGVRKRAADGRSRRDDFREGSRIAAGGQVGLKEVLSDNAHSTRAGAATSVGVFPFTAETAHSPLFILPLFLAV